MVTKELARSLAEHLYYNGSFALKRKNKEAASVVDWIRPAWLKEGSHNQRWLPSEDRLLLRRGPKIAFGLIEDRSSGAIGQRYQRLKTNHELLRPHPGLVYAGMSQAELDDLSIAATPF
jgi:hypothetical protein